MSRDMLIIIALLRRIKINFQISTLRLFCDKSEHWLIHFLSVLCPIRNCSYCFTGLSNACNCSNNKTFTHSQMQSYASLCVMEEVYIPPSHPPRIHSDKLIYMNVSHTATARETLCSILHDYANRQLRFIRLLWIRGFVNGFHKSPILQSSFYLFVFSAVSFPPSSLFFCFHPSSSSALKSCHFIGTKAAHENCRLSNQFLGTGLLRTRQLAMPVGLTVMAALILVVLAAGWCYRFRLASNFGQDTAYPDCEVLWLSSVPSDRC
jgi:hypothetical protein